MAVLRQANQLPGAGKAGGDRFKLICVHAYMDRPCEVVGHANLNLARLAPVPAYQFKQPFCKAISPEIPTVDKARTRREQMQR